MKDEKPEDGEERRKTVFNLRSRESVDEKKALNENLLSREFKWKTLRQTNEIN